MSRINLTEDGGCWVNIYTNLLNLDEEKFYKELMEECPEELGKVLVYNKDTGEHIEKEIFRKYKSYGFTPDFDETVKKSYMFCEKSENPPKCIKALLGICIDYNQRFNNCLVNWYTSKEEYIQPHSDCTAKMVDDAKILILNFNETDNATNIRDFVIESKPGFPDFELRIPLTQGLAILMGGDTQKRFNHHVPPSKHENSRRISVTLRQMKES